MAKYGNRKGVFLLDLTKQEKQVLEYLKDKHQCKLDEVADNLCLDYDELNIAVAELEKQKLIKYDPTKEILFLKD